MPLAGKDRVKQAVTTGGTGSLVIGSASSGYQALAAGDDGKLFPYVIEDGTAWETGYGTYTHSGTGFARTYRSASSTGSALSVSTSAYLMVDAIGEMLIANHLSSQAGLVNARLTLESGVPYSTTDQTAKTNVYVTPVNGNIITLWDSSAGVWRPVQFSELTQAIGTVTVDIGHDIFVYLSSGVAAVEKLAWSSATARATAITYQDGRLCKSGDKTRLYIGSFYSKTTTTTEDSVANRFVYNEYNQADLLGTATDNPTAYVYSTATFRVWRGTTYAANPTAFSNRFFGRAGNTVNISADCVSDGGVGHHSSVGDATASVGPTSRKSATTSYGRWVTSGSIAATLGLNSHTLWQYGGSDSSLWRSIAVTTQARQ